MPEADDTLVASRCVALVETGGDRPSSFLSGDRRTWRAGTCQVLVRSNREDYDNGRALASSIWDKLHHAAVSGYVLVSAREAMPYYLPPPDTSDRHFWSINIIAEWVETLT
jgi:hypothetical protein